MGSVFPPVQRGAAAREAVSQHTGMHGHRHNDASRRGYELGGLGLCTIKHQLFGFILRKETRRFWSQGLVEALHARGMRVLVCGPDLDDPDVLAQCLEWHCDFLLTDSPDVLQSVIQRV